eukprot:scaffold22638_cov138-Cylindrotheca_fusiformis.AAC.5
MLRLPLSLLLVASSSAFTTNVQSVARLSPLHIGATWDWNIEGDESFLMKQAQSCVNSDACSLEESQECLENVIRVQSACSSGSLLGSEVCDDVDDVASLVATLRERIDRQVQRMRVMKAGSTAISVSLAMVALTVCATGLIHNDPAVAPFTLQEWWWSIRDGYFPLMIKEYYENGGLATAQSEATPFTMQEVWWAVKGGFFNDMAAHYFRNGGLGLAGDEQMASSAPFTSQEWLFAAQGGYLDHILSQTFVNGGLADLSADIDPVLPLTPQELVWAAQGNYLNELVKSYIEKGGL